MEEPKTVVVDCVKDLRKKWGVQGASFLLIRASLRIKEEIDEGDKEQAQSLHDLASSLEELALDLRLALEAEEEKNQD